jgi:hypothetical protein
VCVCVCVGWGYGCAVGCVNVGVWVCGSVYECFLLCVNWCGCGCGCLCGCLCWCGCVWLRRAPIIAIGIASAMCVWLRRAPTIAIGIASAIWSWEPCFDTCIDETPHHRNPSNCTEPGSLLTSPSCTSPWPPPATGSRWSRGTWHRRCSSRSRPETTPKVHQTSNATWRLRRCCPASPCFQ